MKIFLTIILILFVTPCFGGGKWVTGDELLSDCMIATKLLDNNSGSHNEHLHAGLCIGYVTGVIGTTHEEVMVGDNANTQICIPKDASTRQLIRVFNNFAEMNADMLHRNAAGLVLLAFFESFPCK